MAGGIRAPVEGRVFAVAALLQPSPTTLTFAPASLDDAGSTFITLKAELPRRSPPGAAPFKRERSDKVR